VSGTTSFFQGWATTSQVAAARNKTETKIQPKAVVPTPTYLSPEARITKVMAGRM
jgi:hypothetical protein